MHKVNSDGQYTVTGFEALAIAALNYAKADDILWKSLQTSNDSGEEQRDREEAAQRLRIAAANFVIDVMDVALGKPVPTL